MQNLIKNLTLLLNVTSIYDLIALQMVKVRTRQEHVMGKEKVKTIMI